MSDSGSHTKAASLRKRPIQLRSATWKFVAGWLAHATDSEMSMLGVDQTLLRTDSASAWGAVASRLLVVSGAWRHADLMTNTVVALDTEFVLTSAGATELAADSPKIELRVVGGQMRRKVKRQSLLSALLAGTEVDQLD